MNEKRSKSTGLGERGFTLIELLVVLVILGLVAGVAGPRVLQYLDKAKTDTARLQVEELGASLDLFYLDQGRYPSTEEGLRALVEPPTGMQSWNGPYLKKPTLPQDPWGRDYRYRSPGEHGRYDLFTLGADNAEGGTGNDQDVTSWQ
ncbi:MAG: type II secretion system protein GspG [Spiribacter salinus]|uniref:Type II secretion system core protein G n=1 Tax=Spiribacter salinus TaxID=1335746 RepID=A0A540VSJ0_9GAMM|nr:MAG: type II secretion system protein GspG [Spiribacter salinus]